MDFSRAEGAFFLSGGWIIPSIRTIEIRTIESEPNNQNRIITAPASPGGRSLGKFGAGLVERFASKVAAMSLVA